MVLQYVGCSCLGTKLYLHAHRISYSIFKNIDHASKNKTMVSIYQLEIIIFASNL